MSREYAEETLDDYHDDGAEFEDSEFEDEKEVLIREEMIQLILNCRLTSLGRNAHGYVIYESVAINLVNKLCDLLESNQKETK